MSDIDHGATAAAVDAMDAMGADARPDTEVHLELSPARPATADDSTRADMLLVDVRAALRRYRDVRVAAADGFEELPDVDGKHSMHHLSNWAWAAAEGRRFDAAKPTSLLYREDAGGTLRLAGAMYTAPGSATTEELDQRIPVSLARWHRHINWCTPKSATGSHWVATQNGSPLYGPRSPVATRDACIAGGGVFYPRVFGWMVHVAIVGSDDPGVVWRGEIANTNSDSTMPHDTAARDSTLQGPAQNTGQNTGRNTAQNTAQDTVQDIIPPPGRAPAPRLSASAAVRTVADPRPEHPTTIVTVDTVARSSRPRPSEMGVGPSSSPAAAIAIPPAATPPPAATSTRTVFPAPVVTAGSYRSGNATVAYDRFLPPGHEGLHPAVVLLHDGMGLAQQAASFHELVMALAQHGYEVEVVHYLDRTGTVTVDADARRVHFREWAGSVRDALTDLAHAPGIDPDRLGLLGTGVGATLALTVGATDPRVKAVAEYSGAIPARAATLIQRMPPVLIAQGDKDRAVPVMEAYRIRALCQAVQAPVELDVFYGQGHVIEGADADHLRRKTLAFFDRYLASAR
jgi:dienelactone hydrolase